MNDDLYETPQGDEPQDGEPQAKEGDDGEQATFLVNKTAFPTAKPGDEIMGRVVRVHEEELEIAPMKKEEGEEKEPQMAAVSGDDAGGGDSLMD